MSPSFWSSLRTRLLLLVLLAIVPALGLILYTASAQRHAAEREAQEDALRLAKSIAANEGQVNEGARQLLTALAQLPSVQEGNWAECNQLFSSFLKQYRLYANFGVLDAQGLVRCSGLPLPPLPINAADRPYFQRAIQTRNFAVGDYQIGRVTRKATLNFGYPVLNEIGQAQAVVFAALDLSRLNQLAAEAQLPPETVLLVTDPKGTVLVHYPDAQAWVGRSFPEAPIIQTILTQREGMVEAVGLDGAERIYAFTPINRRLQNQTAYVSVGISKAAAFAPANALLARNLASLGAVAALALWAAWFGGNWFILRHIQSLVLATRRLSEGHLEVRSGLPYTYGELGQLARAFDTMAEALQQREAALRANAQKLQSFVEANVIGILFGDVRGGIQEANNEFLRIIGYQRQELNSGQLQWTDITPPEYLPLDEQHVAEAQAAGACTPYEKEYIRKDDSRVPVLVGYSLVGETREELVAFILDLSDRKQAEAALRESETRFRTLADNIAQLVWMADSGGWIFWYNQRWFDYTGTTLEEMEGWGWQKVHHPDYVERVTERFRRHVASGDIWEDTFPLRGKDDQYRWFLSRAVPIRDEQGKVLRWFGTNTDITERLQAEAEREQLLRQEQAAREQAQAANRVKDEFLAVLSHELRTPLNPILGWTKLLRSRKFDEAVTDRALETIERNARLQTQLIEDLLDVSRILQGKLNLNVTAVDLKATIEAALETVRLAAQAKAIQIQTDFQAEVGPVSGDAVRLQQVVWNLLSNAIKFTPQGERVQVRLEEVEAGVQIQVTDTGQGIPAGFLPHVFESFRQADSTTTRTFGGLGLGLAICRHLVELHGGTIEASSAGEGQGSTFTVRLPLLRNQPMNHQQHSSKNHEPDVAGLRILVVEDNADSRGYLVFVLEQAGAAVSAAASAAEGLEVLKQFQPDVLVCDIGMPLEDGYAFLRKVRALPPQEGGKIPAIALTAYAKEEDRQQALAAGFQEHLPKPVEPTQLLIMIARLI